MPALEIITLEFEFNLHLIDTTIILKSLLQESYRQSALL